MTCLTFQTWTSYRVPEVKELYDLRYAKLMQDTGIRPDQEFE
jgi:hypothetical protein